MTTRKMIRTTGWVALVGALLVPDAMEAQQAGRDRMREGRTARMEARADRGLARQARLLELTDGQRAHLEEIQDRTRAEREAHRERLREMRAEFIETLDETQQARLETVQRLRADEFRQRARSGRRGGDAAFRGRSGRRGDIGRGFRRGGFEPALPEPGLDDGGAEIFALELTEVEWPEVALPEPHGLEDEAGGLFGN